MRQISTKVNMHIVTRHHCLMLQKVTRKWANQRIKSWAVRLISNGFNVSFYVSCILWPITR